MTHYVNEFADRKTPQTYHFNDLQRVSNGFFGYVKSELKRRGAVAYDVWLPETHYLPHLLHKNEHIMGSVYGRYDNGPNKTGRGVLVATDQRVLFLDKKPMFLHVDELSYMIIGGVTFSKSLIMGYVTLHSRLGDYKLRTFNFKNAANFVDYIETKCLQPSLADDIKFNHVT